MIINHTGYICLTKSFNCVDFGEISRILKKSAGFCRIFFKPVDSLQIFHQVAPVITYKNACDEICEEAEEWEPEVGGEEEITDFAGIITTISIIIMMIITIIMMIVKIIIIIMIIIVIR